VGATLFKVLLWVWGTLIVGIGVNWVSNVVEWKSLLQHPLWASAGFLFLAGSTGWTYRSYRFAEAAQQPQPDDASAWNSKGVSPEAVGRHAEALVAYGSVLFESCLHEFFQE
jgi:hypothetical protein